MSFHLVFFLMGAILVGLWALSPIFREREKKNMKLEVTYFESLNKFKDGKLDKSKLLDKGVAYFNNLGFSLEDAKKRVEKDLSSVNSSI